MKNILIEWEMKSDKAVENLHVAYPDMDANERLLVIYDFVAALNFKFPDLANRLLTLMTLYPAADIPDDVVITEEPRE